MVSTLILAKENRVMIEAIEKSVKEIKLDVKDAFNHMSKRLPGWATISLTVLSALVTGLIVAAVK